MSRTIKTQGKEELFATQTEAQLVRVRTYAAAIKALYDTSTAGDQAAINAILNEAVVLCPGS